MNWCRLNPKAFIVSFIGVSLFAFGAPDRQTVVLGPGALRLTEGLSISAERIEVRGPVVTNGFALTFTAREIEFVGEGKILSFDQPAAPNLDVKPKLPAPDTAPGRTPGRSGAAGEVGYKGHSGKLAPAPISIYASLLIGNVTVDGTGQAGGFGGCGQAGQDGGVGGKGRASKRSKSFLWRNTGPGNGSPGGAGGIGGAGGEGGDGGDSVFVEVHYGLHQVRDATGSLHNSPNPLAVCSAPGAGGPGGAPGANGVGGEGGQAGDRSRILWGRGESASRGPAGPSPTQIAVSGAMGKSSVVPARTLVEQTYSALAQQQQQAESIVATLNQVRKTGHILTDLMFAVESSSQISSEQMVERIRIAHFRVQELLKARRIAKVDSNLDKINAEAEALLLSLDFYLSNLTGKLSNAELARLQSRSEKNFLDSHRYAIPQLQKLCSEMSRLSSVGNGQQEQVAVLAAYRLFGPQMLEDWLLGGGNSATRAELSVGAPLKAELTGYADGYPVIIQDYQKPVSSQNFNQEGSNVLP